MHRWIDRLPCWRADPEASGVINYLNKFGSTGPTKGNTGGEFVLRALRYFQGKQPPMLRFQQLDRRHV